MLSLSEGEERIQKVGSVKLVTSRHVLFTFNRRRDRDLRKSCRSFLQFTLDLLLRLLLDATLFVWGIGNQCFLCSEIIFIYFS